jgi:hypothetical protein
MKTDNLFIYTDHDGAKQVLKGCRLTVDEFDRHWIWSDQLQQNIVFRTRGLDNALLAAIDGLLDTVQLRDERIKALQRLADLATAFADKVKPNELLET